MNTDQWMESQDPILSDVLASGAYPTFLKVAESADFDFDLDTLFEFGLQRMLDGLAAMLSGRQGLTR
jgi:thiamine monophosphate kinase